MIDSRVQAGDFDPGRQLQRLQELGIGAVASFIALADEAIQVEHYPPLARNVLAAAAREAEGRWSLAGVILIHRFGRLGAGERLAFAAAAAPDPASAQEACAYLVDALRTRAPFWRSTADGNGGG